MEGEGEGSENVYRRVLLALPHLELPLWLVPALLLVMLTGLSRFPDEEAADGV